MTRTYTDFVVGSSGKFGNPRGLVVSSGRGGSYGASDCQFPIADLGLDDVGERLPSSRRRSDAATDCSHAPKNLRAITFMPGSLLRGRSGGTATPRGAIHPRTRRRGRC